MDPDATPAPSATEAFPASEPFQPMSSDATTDRERLVAAARALRGLPWATQTGWAVAVLGLGLVAYSLWWATENAPNNFNPGGVSGINVGLGVFGLGVIAGILFELVPGRRAGPFDPAAGPEAWGLRARAERYQAQVSDGLAWTGRTLALLGLAGAAYVYRTNVLAGSGPGTLTLAGLEQTYASWGAAFLGLAAAGVVVWVIFAVRGAALRGAFRAYVAAVGASARAADAPPAPADASPTSLPGAGPLPGGIQEQELLALMKKIDAMLATLPDDTVAAFSKTAEAETYLKLLGGKT